MDRMKTFLKYALWVIMFFVFSELIINVGLNSSYKDMQSKNNIEQVIINQAQTTLINGRIKGKIINTGDKDLNGKYLKVDIYSERDVLLGSKYYEIQNLARDEFQDFELYFKAQYAKYYELSIVDEKAEEELNLEIEFLPKDLNKPEIWVATIATMLILW